MKGQNTWSYTPYKPFLFDVGEIYVCRVVPYKDSIHIEWLDCGGECEIYFRQRGEETFLLAGRSNVWEFDIRGLNDNYEYEFYVACGGKKSRVRLARCAEAVGTVVNYLHPDDRAYSFSGRYLCSSSLLRL